MAAKDNCKDLNLPDDAVGKTLRAFIEGQYALDGTTMSDCFSKDAVFNGRMFQRTGQTEINKLYVWFLANAMKSYRVEAAAPTLDKKQWIITTEVFGLGFDGGLIVVDLLTFDEEGKICRLDNCFDTQKVNPADLPTEE